MEMENMGCGSPDGMLAASGLDDPVLEHASQQKSRNKVVARLQHNI